jgi:hypothetical protein
MHANALCRQSCAALLLPSVTDRLAILLVIDVIALAFGPVSGSPP